MPVKKVEPAILLALAKQYQHFDFKEYRVNHFHELCNYLQKSGVSLQDLLAFMEETKKHNKTVYTLDIISFIDEHLIVNSEADKGVLISFVANTIKKLLESDRDADTRDNISRMLKSLNKHAIGDDKTFEIIKIRMVNKTSIYFLLAVINECNFD